MIPASVKTRLAQFAPPVIAGALPALLLSIGVTKFVLTHFLSHAPYLLDSGWYSALIYHDGLLPQNPVIACDYLDQYFAFHFSPLLSAFSLLSYLSPLDRIEWYAVFEGIVFFPLGIATYALASRNEPASLLRRLPITAFASLAFATNGLVLNFIGYPHYEPAIPGLICLLLAASVTGRFRLAWVFLALTVSVREDAGFHAAVALTPLLYLNLRGIDTSSSRRTLIKLIVGAVSMSVAGILIQRLFFHPYPQMRELYLGSPAYGHLSLQVLAHRLWVFFTACEYIYYPFIATCLVAAWRRDPRYLLGWAVTVPWFVFNLTAFQEIKAGFSAYTGFPFVTSIFWVLVYGARLAPVGRRLRPGAIEAVFAVVCVSSTVGAFQATPLAMKVTMRDMVLSGSWPRAEIHRFVEVLGEHHTTFGRLYVDPALAAIALESVGRENTWYPGVTPADTIAFHRDTFWGDPKVVPDLITNQLDVCTHVVKTKLYVCMREPPPPETFTDLATETFPSLFALAGLDKNVASVEARGLVIRTPSVVEGRLGELPAGGYELTISLEPGSAHTARLDLVTEPTLGVSTTTTTGSDEVVLGFEADGRQALRFRIASVGTAPLVITHARLRRR